MKTEKKIKKAAPFLFGAAQILGSAIFSLVLSVFLVVCSILFCWQLHSMSDRIDRLEKEQQEMAQLAEELRQQRARLNETGKQDEKNDFQDFDATLDKFLDRAIKINEAMQKAQNEKIL